MQKEIIKEIDTTIWQKSIRIGKINLLFGVQKSIDVSSFFIEKQKKKNEKLFIHQHSFQKINNGVKVRIAHHSRMQILKKT